MKKILLMLLFVMFASFFQFLLFHSSKSAGGPASIFLLPSSVYLYASSDEADIYFNSAMEKYLQGNFTSAVEDLEKAQLLDPQNAKINEFSVKILLEAASQNHMSRNYKQAFEYLKKAQKIDPSNPKVQEMYQLTQELLSPGREQTIPREKKQSLLPSKAEETADIKKQPAQAKKTVVSNTTPSKKPKLSLPATVLPAAPKASGLPAVYILLIIWAGSATVILVILWVILASKVKTIKNTVAKLRETEDKFYRTSDARNILNIELERIRESVKYERDAAERLRNEIKENKKRDEERYRLEMELKTKQIEERVRSEMIRKQTGKPAQQDAFVHQQQAKVLEYMGDSVQAGDSTSPALEAIRERIASMAQNLHDYAPAAAMNFLKQMMTNENPLVRANVVLALSRISKSDTIELLLNLIEDKDDIVKREVIKNLKLIKRRVDAGTLEISETHKTRIQSLLDDELTKGEWIF
ncbi:MAG: HEAT repeat domain-containing protein [Elusimicrobiota bacterium]